MTTISNTSPGSPSKRFYAQALPAPARRLSPFGNATRAISEPPAGSSKTYHGMPDPSIKLLVEHVFRYLPPVNTSAMPPQQRHHSASVAAVKFRATHTIMHFPAFPDCTCIPH